MKPCHNNNVAAIYVGRAATGDKAFLGQKSWSWFYICYIILRYTRDYVYLTIILRSRTENRLILSRGGRGQSWLKFGGVLQD